MLFVHGYVCVNLCVQINVFSMGIHIEERGSFWVPSSIACNFIFLDGVTHWIWSSLIQVDNPASKPFYNYKSKHNKICKTGTIKINNPIKHKQKYAQLHS